MPLAYLWPILAVDLMVVLAVSFLAHMVRSLGGPRIPGSVLLRLGRVRVSIPLGAILAVQAAGIAVALWFQRMLAEIRFD